VAALNAPPLNSTAVGCTKVLPFHFHRSVVRGRHCAGLAGQERGEVARHAGILRVGSAICARPVRRAICGRSVTADSAKRSIRENSGQFPRVNSALSSAHQ